MSIVARIPDHGPLDSGSPGCTPRSRVTRTLLGYLALAGPFYVAVSLAQALTRDGFDLTRNEWSLLAVGHLGWIQTLNFAATGAMLVAGAVGVRRCIGRSAPGGTWAPLLLAGYGVALVGAGLFTADPAGGFPPPDTPDGPPATLSWHGALHLLVGSIGFAALIAACLVVARMYSRHGWRVGAGISRIVGVVFTAAFAGIATGAGHPAINLAFTGAVVLSWAWLSVVAMTLYLRAGTLIPRPGVTSTTSTRNGHDE